MRIVSLHLHSFGAIVDECLELSEGLNVVSGPNEAGKSTWHAAATLLLTGFPKTMRSKAVKPLYERYKPWSGSEYKISGVVELDDGRRLRIVRDFVQRTSEIHEEGRGPLRTALTTDASCDLAELVGLDRATLPLVASVRQTEILELARSATATEGATLRDFLQRSLASRCEGDVTAESAIEAIDRYRRASIGTNKQGSNKPLRRAVEAAHAADAAYQHGVLQWEQYHQRERELAADRERRSALRAKLAEAQAESLRSERARLVQLVDEIEAIDARLCGSVDSAAVPSDDHLDQARQLWARQSVFEERCRNLQVLKDKRDQLRTEIAGLPAEVGAGTDTVPASIAEARGELEDARRRVALVESEQPESFSTAVVIDDDPGFIRSVAAELEVAVPSVDSELPVRRDELKARTLQDQHRATRLVWFGIVGLIAAIVCVGIGSIGAMAVGFVLLGVSAMAIWRSLQTRQRVGVQLSKVLEVDRRIALETERLDANRARRRELEAIVARWGCRPTPNAVRQVAVRVEEHRAMRDLTHRWEERRALADRRVRSATAQLARALADAGYPPHGPSGSTDSLDSESVVAAAEQFDAEVRANRHKRAAVARRLELVDQCALVDAAIETGERTERRIDAYVRAVDSFLAMVGWAEPGQSIDEQLGALERWLSAGRELRSRWHADEQLRARRDVVCAHGQPDDLRERIAELERTLAQGGVARSEPSHDRRRIRPIAQLEAEYREVQERIDRSQGALSELASQLTELTELSEERAKAHADLDRVLRQEELLSHAQDHLNAARSRVHSAIAPQLVRATADRLALVTAGRYKRLDINPDDLSVHVEVAAGTWHDSSRLSFGTVEQIYLLLRTAIAELVSPDTETCPLLLDDATVHADGDRTQALIDVLGDLARDRQVIVFSQEAVVRSASSHGGATIIDLAA